MAETRCFTQLAAAISCCGERNSTFDNNGDIAFGRGVGDE
jgi:hypothetical protein